MQSKPKILVLKMRELVYTGIFLFLAVVLIVLLVLMFRTEKAPEKRTSISTERYTAGVYSSPVTLGDTVVDVTVTVDPDRIKAIDLNNLSETTSTMYPLIRPAVEELEAQNPTCGHYEEGNRKYHSICFNTCPIKKYKTMRLEV